MLGPSLMERPYPSGTLDYGTEGDVRASGVLVHLSKVAKNKREFAEEYFQVQDKSNRTSV